MFKINVLTVGRNKEEWIDEAIAHYLTMLKKYASVTMTYIADVRDSGRLNDVELKRAEARLTSRQFKSSYQIALSERGTKYDSKEFARHLSLLMSHHSSCDLIVGGRCGLDDSILEACAETFSLSPLTMSHELVRPVLLEQLYRAFSIIAGGKYHR